MNQYERLKAAQWNRTIITAIVIIIFVLLIFFMFADIFIPQINTDRIFFTFMLWFMLLIFSILISQQVRDGWMWAKWYLKIESQWKPCVIEIDNVNKSFVENKKFDFFTMYHDQKILEENYTFDIKQEWNKTFLIFSQPIEFKTFIFWVNYLTFLDYREYDVVWRYPAEIWVQTNAPTFWFSFLNSKKDIMIYCENKRKWDINNVHCVLNNGFSFIKKLYLNKYDRPPSYKYIVSVPQMAGTLFKREDVLEYREMPNI